MPRYEEQAFVLDVADYRESSLLLRVLTRHEGRLSLVGKGARKPKKGGSAPGGILQPFSLVRLQFTIKDGQTLGNLISAEAEATWPVVHEHLESYAVCSYWFEILRETSHAGNSADVVFTVTRAFLDEQAKAPGLSGQAVMLIGELLQALGYGFSWQRCSVCNGTLETIALFSVKTGPLCARCAGEGHHGLSVRPDEARVIKLMLQGAPLAPAELMPIAALLNRYIVYHLERPLKTFTFMEKAAG